MRQILTYILLFTCTGLFCQNTEDFLFHSDYYYIGMTGYAMNTRFTIYPDAVVNDNSKAVYHLVGEDHGIRTYKGNVAGNTWTELAVDANYDIVEKIYMETGYLPYIGNLTYIISQNIYSKGHVENPSTVYVPVPYPVPSYYDYYTPPRTWQVCPYCRGMGYTTVYHPNTPPGHIHCSFCGGRGIYQM